MSDLTKQTLVQLAESLAKKKTTSREITEAFIANIEKNNSTINAVVHSTFDLAREMANASDSRWQSNKPLSALDGIPITLKDVICTQGIPTTACSRSLENFIPPYNATVWKHLKDAGLVLLGKVNTDEFTMGASTETSCFGVTKNPHDTTKVAGGSSGGSAAAVAANFCAASIGTDTGGSIRQPASFCGVSGLKVSYGRVSRYGTIPMASSLDTVGPLAKTVQDCAAIMQIIARPDPRDSTTISTAPPNYLDSLSGNLNNITIGIPKEYSLPQLNASVMSNWNSAKAIMTDLGAKMIDISLPHTEYALPVYYLIAPSEISANMARYDGLRFGVNQGQKSLEEIYASNREYGFGDEVKRRILLGTYALSAGYYDAFYRKAQKVRTLIKKDFDDAFEQVDAILTPTTPSVAFTIGSKTDDPLQMYLEDALTIPASLAGICGLSVPIGSANDGLPIGMQILCPTNAEEKVLKIGHILQTNL